MRSPCLRVSVVTFLFLPLTAFSPAGKTPDFTFTTDAEKMTTDNLGNVYLIKEQSIKKYDVKGVFQKEYSNKNFGSITSVDATNPLRITLFYRDFNRVVFLDNTMSQNGDPIQLEALGFPMATLAASSHNNGMWIYDAQNFELIRFGQTMQIEQRTGNLSQLLGIDLQPDFLIEKDNRLFLSNPSTGVLVFDIYGTYSKTIPVKNLKALQVVDDNIVYYQKPALNSWNLISNETTVFDAPQDTAATDMRLEKYAVFVLKEKLVEIYNRPQ